MLPAATDQLLTQMEVSVEQVALALVGGDADLLQAVSEELRQVTQAVAQHLAQLPPQQRRNAGLRLRLQHIQGAMLAQRGGLARYSARAQHALHAIMPGARDDTYGARQGRYGSGRKQAGAFKVLAA